MDILLLYLLLSHYIEGVMALRKFGWVFLASAIVLAGCQTNNNEGEVNDTKPATEVQTEAVEEEIVTDLDREEFNGYWAKDDLYFYIDEQTLYLQNSENNYVNSYNIQSENISENTLTISLGSIREANSVSYLDENRELAFTKEDEQLKTSDYILDSATEDAMSERLLTFVETDGAVGALDYQGPDLSIEDFSGYWVPIDKYHLNDDVRTDLGNYFVLMSEKIQQTGYFQGSLITFPIHDYEIIDNSLYTTEELWLDQFDAFEMGYSDHIERDLIHSKYTLFPEEDDRDRLVLHASGMILQRASLGEMMEHFHIDADSDQGSTGTSEDFTNILANLSEDDYTITEINNVIESIQAENYPYSIGELSEMQLYKEMQIINGDIPPFEEAVNPKQAIEQLLSNSFSSTSSYHNTGVADSVYQFTADFDEPLLTFGYVGRTHWHSGPESLFVDNIIYEHPIYTIDFIDRYGQPARTQRFFRISDNVIYPENYEGKFLDRYEINAEWEDYHNMPNRN